jgi:hypothetical protein
MIGQQPGYIQVSAIHLNRYKAVDSIKINSHFSISNIVESKEKEVVPVLN